MWQPKSATPDLRVLSQWVASKNVATSHHVVQQPEYALSALARVGRRVWRRWASARCDPRAYDAARAPVLRDVRCPHPWPRTRARPAATSRSGPDPPWHPAVHLFIQDPIKLASSSGGHIHVTGIASPLTCPTFSTTSSSPCTATDPARLASHPPPTPPAPVLVVFATVAVVAVHVRLRPCPPTIVPHFHLQ